jgi:hypothetical protein
VVFALSGAQSKNITESRAPYALYGDNNSGDYYAWTPVVGSYTLKATPFTASGGTGTAGSDLTVNFTIVDQAPITSISEINQENSSLKLYPNPSIRGEDVHIEVENLGLQKQATLFLIDINGRILEVKQVTTDDKGNASTVLSAGKRLIAGVYIIQIKMPEGQLQRRLVVK